MKIFLNGRPSGEGRNHLDWIPAFAGMTFLIFFMGINLDAASEDILEMGKEEYGNYCARCHGPSGLGNGSDANRLPVLPRNFSLGEYKFRSTVSGTPPSDADLMHVINKGIAKGGMPGFANLPIHVKESIVAYIKSIKQQGEDKSIFELYDAEPIPAPLVKIKPNLAEGKKQYELLQCALCHGNARANGTSAATLKDSQGNPIPAANLTQGWTYGGGNSPTDIYNRLMAGLAGTPMPAYEGAIEPVNAWHLANYVHSLQKKTNWQAPVMVKEISGALPEDPQDSKWSQVSYSDVRLEGNAYQGGRKLHVNINAIEVRAIKSGENVAYKLSWNDPTETRTSPPDQVLIAFQPEGWDKIPQENLYTQYQSSNENLDVIVWQSDNPATAAFKKSNVVNALYPWSKKEADLSAQATFSDGLWELVVIVPHENPAIKKTYISFAAWDGSNNEAGPKRANSQWIPVHFGAVEVVAH